MARWVPVSTLEAASRRPITTVQVDERQLILVRDAGQLHAFDRACPHELADLAKGRCVAGRLVCPRHAASFDLATGATSPNWDFADLRRYEVAIVDGHVLVDVLVDASASCRSGITPA